jgi:hypothetical protein
MIPIWLTLPCLFPIRVQLKSKLLDLIGKLVEPGIEGINAVEVNDSSASKSGFVVAYIPASNGLPRRSRKDWKFYLRIGSGTFPMEYFQIAEMFGQRPQPRLDLVLEEDCFPVLTEKQVNTYGLTSSILGGASRNSLAFVLRDQQIISALINLELTVMVITAFHGDHPNRNGRCSEVELMMSSILERD